MNERRPEVIVLENVTGLASSHNREDLRAAVKEFNTLGYAVDAITWTPDVLCHSPGPGYSL